MMNCERFPCLLFRFSISFSTPLADPVVALQRLPFLSFPVRPSVQFPPAFPPRVVLASTLVCTPAAEALSTTEEIIFFLDDRRFPGQFVTAL